MTGLTSRSTCSTLGITTEHKERRTIFERYTERARQVIILATDEARRMQHNFIGTEHILIGLLAEDEGIAAEVLDRLGVTIDEVRASVLHITGKGVEPVAAHLAYTPRANNVLKLAIREALSLDHNYVGTEHLLLALVRENLGVAASVLNEEGVTPEKVRNAIGSVLGVVYKTPEPEQEAPDTGDEPASPKFVEMVEAMAENNELADFVISDVHFADRMEGEIEGEYYPEVGGMTISVSGLGLRDFTALHTVVQEELTRIFNGINTCQVDDALAQAAEGVEES